MAVRTLVYNFHWIEGRFVTEVWDYTGTFTAGTDTVAAVVPSKGNRNVKSVRGNFDNYTVSNGAYTFTFSATVAKPWVSFTSYGR